MSQHAIAIIPAYNEAAHIGGVIADIEATGVVDDTIVIDDASTDDTVDVVKETSAQLIENEHNLNKGGAVKRGYTAALEQGADIVYRLDADGQHNPMDLPKFQARLQEQGCAYVLGNRFGDPSYRKSMPRARRYGNRVVSYVTSIRLGQFVHDPTCGYRGMDAAYLRSIPYREYSTDYKFGVEELLAYDYLDGVIGEITIDCIYDEEESTLTYYDGLKYLYPSVAWWNSAKDYRTD